MLFRLILSILSMALEVILSEFLRWVLLLLWIRLKKKITLLNFLKKIVALLTLVLNLILKAMKNSNIWKIVIGAISAAFGYILNSIGL